MKFHAVSRSILAVLGLSMFALACSKDLNTTPPDAANVSATDRGNPILPATPYNYANIALPNYLTTPQINGQNNTPASNPITNAGATLGRVLFYDPNLSANNTIKCASCHRQANSFSDPNQFSLGFAGGFTTRNSMSLLNARFYPNGHFFWDERAASAEAQASGPIKNPVEMGMTMPGLVTKLQGVSFYPALFQAAFGTPGIDSSRIVRSIAQFVRSMVAYRSKYDTGRAALPPGANPANTNFANFTAQENQGKGIFFGPAGGCAQCHGTETFTAPGGKDNGLDLVYTDNGIGAVTGNPAQNGLFKVPSLRGIGASGPYMHDGRFQTLNQVVEHYNSQVKPHVNLSQELKAPNGQPRRLNLTAAQKTALVAFLNTLTDTGIAGDVKYSNPF